MFYPTNGHLISDWKPHTRKSRTGFPMYMDIALGNVTKV